MADNTYEILMDCFTGNTLNTTEAPDNTFEVLRAVHDTELPALRVNVINLGGSTAPIIGTHNPEVTEYPDGYSGYTSGVWAIAGMVSEPFTYTTGALAGQEVSNGNGIVWDGISWSIIQDGNNSVVLPTSPTLWVKGFSVTGFSPTAIRTASNQGNGGNATGDYDVAMGSGTIASGGFATSTGRDTVASGIYSFAGGKQTEASGEGAVTFGDNTIATGEYSFTANILNYVSGDFSTVFGGYDDGKGNVYGNTGETQCCFIGGGYNNNIKGSDNSSSIVGGVDNTIDAKASLVGGGVNHIINGNYSAIAGGSANEINSLNGFIGGGYGNELLINKGSSNVSIVGGSTNTITDGTNSIILGGVGNDLVNENAFCVGGIGNISTDSDAGNSGFIGGTNNTIDDATGSVIIGGSYQTATQNDMVYVPAVTFKSGTAPTAPTKGTMYFDGGSNQFMGYNGTTWVVLG